MTENAFPQVVYLPLDWVYTRHNVRRNVDPAELEELAESIRRVGVLQPIVVQPDNGKLAVPCHQLVCGSRRLQAAKLAGLHTIPAIVRDLTDQEAREVQLIENLQRRDLDPIDEAQAYRELLDQHDYKQETLAQRLGVSQAQVSNRLRLLRLPDEVQSNISREILSAGHGLALLKLEKSPKALVRAAHHLAETKTPVAETADAIERFAFDKGKPLADGGGRRRPSFAVAGCKECPNKVQGRPGWGDPVPVCLDAACWERKQAEADKMTEADQQAQARELTARGVEVLTQDDLQKLSWNSYESLGSYDLRNVDLTGCAETCEHRKLVQQRHRDEPQPYCFNVPCLRKKKAAATRAGQAAKAAAHDTRVTAVQAWAENTALAVFAEEPVPGGPVDFDAMLLLAALVLGNIQAGYSSNYEPYPRVQTHLKRTRSWDLGLTAAASPSCLVGSAWPALKALLAELDGEKLLALALEWAAVNLGRTELMRWAMGEAAEPVEPKAEDSAASYGGDDLGEGAEAEAGDDENGENAIGNRPEPDEAEDSSNDDDPDDDDKAA